MPTPVPLRRCAVVAALLLAGCSSDGRTLAPARPDQTLSILTTTTTAPPVSVGEFLLLAPWENGTGVPIDQTCDGAGRPPTLTWAGVPAPTVELAVVATDLDAGGRIHWVVAGLDPILVTSMGGEALPPEAVVGTNSGGTVGFEPLCPPAGDPVHRYLFDLYALGSPSSLTPSLPAAEAVIAIQSVALATASVTGTYQR